MKIDQSKLLIDRIYSQYPALQIPDQALSVFQDVFGPYPLEDVSLAVRDSMTEQGRTFPPTCNEIMERLQSRRRMAAKAQIKPTERSTFTVKIPDLRGKTIVINDMAAFYTHAVSKPGHPGELENRSFVRAEPNARALVYQMMQEDGFDVYESRTPINDKEYSYTVFKKRREVLSN